MLSVHEAVKISYLYPLRCQLLKLDYIFWLFVDIHGSVAFPLLLPIDTETILIIEIPNF